MWDPAQYLALGYVARAHGVRGEVHVGLYNEGSAALEELGRVYLVADGATPEPFDVRGVRPVNDGLLVTLGGVDGRDAAEALRGREILARRDELPPLAEDELYVADLVGCEVLTTAGQPLGRVVEVLESGPHPTLVIHQERIERMLPYVPEFVRAVDLEARRISVDPPEGLPEGPV
jgi:16S rRNA processing protein RimM